MSARKVIHALPGGRLKCDACGHREPPAELHEGMIGRACPSCGANMLTREDYEAALGVMQAIEALNAIGSALGIGTEAPDENGKRITINHHNGKTQVDWSPA